MSDGRSTAGSGAAPPFPRSTVVTAPAGDAPAVASPRSPANRIAGLDGLRALAVLGVMAYHFGVGWLPGGFLGVDAFYVLSGYLITTLLVAEYKNAARVRLGAFWARRARRLLPCLVLVILAVSAYVRFVAPAGSYPNFRMESLSTLFYFSNWYQIAAASNYFAATGPVSLLTQTWSLAIEEQFYLVWPVVVIL
ncbi:MAG: acyltransferase family protein, partial [Acidimicrobiales bacterium]